MWESKQRYNFYTIFPLHSTSLHWTIQNILLAANTTIAFLQKASWPGKINMFQNDLWLACLGPHYSTNTVIIAPKLL